VVITQSWQSVLSSELCAIFNLFFLKISWHNKLLGVGGAQLEVAVVVKLELGALVKVHFPPYCFLTNVSVDTPPIYVPHPVLFVDIDSELEWKGSGQI
jgi:hypothetical protein